MVDVVSKYGLRAVQQRSRLFFTPTAFDDFGQEIGVISTAGFN